MKTIIKVAFEEQSKSVVGDCSVILEGDGTEDLRELTTRAYSEATILFDKVFSFAQAKTLKK